MEYFAGLCLFRSVEYEVVATFGPIKVSGEAFKLAKMSVDEAWKQNWKQRNAILPAGSGENA